MDGVPGDAIVLPARLAGMEGIAGAVERADRQPMIGQGRLALAPRLVALQQLRQVEMGSARPIAAGKFQGIEPEPRRGGEQPLEGQASEAVGYHSNLHGSSPLTIGSKPAHRMGMIAPVAAT